MHFKIDFKNDLIGQFVNNLKSDILNLNRKLERGMVDYLKDFVLDIKEKILEDCHVHREKIYNVYEY